MSAQHTSGRYGFIAACLDGGATLGEAMKAADAAGLPHVGRDELIDALQGLYAVSRFPAPGTAPRLEAALRQARIVLAKATGSAA